MGADSGCFLVCAPVGWALEILVSEINADSRPGGPIIADVKEAKSELPGVRETDANPGQFGCGPGLVGGVEDEDCCYGIQWLGGELDVEAFAGLFNF